MEDTVRTNRYVKQHNSSSILLEPHEFVVPTEISVNTLKMMDASIKIGVTITATPLLFVI